MEGFITALSSQWHPEVLLLQGEGRGEREGGTVTKVLRLSTSFHTNNVSCCSHSILLAS